MSKWTYLNCFYAGSGDKLFKTAKGMKNVFTLPPNQNYSEEQTIWTVSWTGSLIEYKKEK